MPADLAQQIKDLLGLGAPPAVRHCPVCGHKGPFRPFGGRRDARCPSCRTLERHRFLKLVTEREPVIRGRLLHFAPEAAVAGFLRADAEEYVSADLMAAADLKLNIEALDLPDRAFDTILCSHVLEHVDDAKALAELYRVLNPGGVAILAVPLVDGWEETYEDPSIRSPAERRLHFGQHDHVRIYGRDFRARVRAAGFTLEERTALGPDCVRHALIRGDKIFLATRPA